MSLIGMICARVWRRSRRAGRGRGLNFTLSSPSFLIILAMPTVLTVIRFMPCPVRPASRCGRSSRRHVGIVEQGSPMPMKTMFDSGCWYRSSDCRRMRAWS